MGVKKYSGANENFREIVIYDINCCLVIRSLCPTNSSPLQWALFFELV